MPGPTTASNTDIQCGERDATMAGSKHQSCDSSPHKAPATAGGVRWVSNDSKRMRVRQTEIDGGTTLGILASVDDHDATAGP